MRVFITGATGFIGGSIARALLARGDDVAILVRSEVRSGTGLDAARVIKGELGRLSDRASEMLSGIDVVVHCAAHVAPFGIWEDFERVNIEGTKELLDAAKSVGVKAFINFSTPSVYVDFRDRENIKESDSLPDKQVSMYGRSKIIADQLVMEAASSGLNACSIRPRAVLGAGDANILPRMIKILSNGRFPLVRGGGALIDATHINNVVQATLLAMDRPEVIRGQIFNISNGQPVSMRQLAERLFASLGKDVRFVFVPWFVARLIAQGVELFYRFTKPGAEPPISVYSIGLTSFTQTLDISKAKSLLGYSPEATLNDAIHDFVRASRS